MVDVDHIRTDLHVWHDLRIEGIVHDPHPCMQARCLSDWILHCRCKTKWHEGMSCAEWRAHRQASDTELLDLAALKRWRHCPNCRYSIPCTYTVHALEAASRVAEALRPSVMSRLRPHHVLCALEPAPYRSMYSFGKFQNLANKLLVS